MGIHTWFKNRVDLTFEEAQQRAINKVSNSIAAHYRILEQIEKESNPKKRNTYNQFVWLILKKKRIKPCN
jgi:hypothetical protein